jgi:hypothetical protein
VGAGVMWPHIQHHRILLAIQRRLNDLLWRWDCIGRFGYFGRRERCHSNLYEIEN